MPMPARNGWTFATLTAHNARRHRYAAIGNPVMEGFGSEQAPTLQKPLLSRLLRFLCVVLVVVALLLIPVAVRFCWVGTCTSSEMAGAAREALERFKSR